MIVTLAELPSSLEECLTRVRAGEEVLLTDLGNPVARMVPVSFTENTKATAAELIHSGQIRPARKKLSERFMNRRLPIEDPKGTLRKAIEQERESGW